MKHLLLCFFFFFTLVLHAQEHSPKTADYTETATGASFAMKYISGNSFSMGSNEDDSEKPIHTVRVGNFFMSKYEVTFEEYDKFCDATSRAKPSDEGWGRGTRPVINVSWDDATAYCAWLSRTTGKTYRLPTEAEWEYACRAGTSTPFNTGENLTTDQANYNGNYPYKNFSKGEYRKKTIPVGSFSPNAFGLYDMHGNVWEWCSDWYKGYPGSSGVSDYPNSFRVLRGGSWGLNGQFCRSSARYYDTPDFRNLNIGFRLVFVP